MQKLPIGIQTFKDIQTQNYLYIDKTEIALELIENFKYVFLSRPRRFGKSLFLDTLHNIFEGHKNLFEGLDIYDRWDFDDTYPVIRIDWSGNFKTIESTKAVARRALEINQERLGLECNLDDEPDICFNRLIHEAYKKYQKPVVILIDEYDKPILDNIEDIQRAHENRDFLRGIYVQLKANDAFIKFVFLTGITKFARASIFSGLNNITDISLMRRYGNICGYTQDDIETTLLPHLEGVDLAKLKKWYNGYNFLKDDIYNPFDILLFISNEHQYKNYWWESGNPYNLITLLQNREFFLPNLQNIKIGDSALASFDIEQIEIASLLFQAGYLTIDEMIVDDELDIIEYTLKVPNREVQVSFNLLMLNYLIDRGYSSDQKRGLLIPLRNGDTQALEQSLVSLFASIPYNNYTKNKIAIYEGYYASVLYAYFAALGVDIIAEDVTNTGRIDITLLLEDKIYILEFKVGQENALEQIKQKNYVQKYLSRGRDIYLVGINFDEQSRGIVGFECEMV